MGEFLLAFLLAFLLVVLAMPYFLRWAKTAALQPIYEDAPASHQAKSNTPTMGGVVFISAAIIAALFAAFISARVDFGLFLGIFVLAGFAGVGVVDDYRKIASGKNHAGLSARAKMLLLILISALAACGLFFSDIASSWLHLPKFGAVFDMGICALGFWVLVMISSANAINLTDGLDGLAASTSISSLAALFLIGFLGLGLHASAPQIAQAAYSVEVLSYTPKSQQIFSILLLACSLAGALAGFWCFNAHPAQVFMGDSGSLALGGFVGFLAIVCKAELLLIIIGAVFVAETLSVIIQVFSFRFFGRRVFKMSPLHHHFEQCGWAENHIIMRFWLFSVLAAALGVYLAA